MCGIAGQIGSDPLSTDRITSTLGLMKRRGPDHQAHRQMRTDRLMVDLLHSRLSIIDCDPRSNQPMSLGNKTIVFNGELYNYREIRTKLSSRGYVPSTESDTEILLAAIDLFGWSILDDMEGMWAFALFDADDRSLTLCRDRFGEKPLYLFQENDRLLFGSEIKLLQSMRGNPFSINRNHVLRYLINGYKALYKTHGESFFEGVQEVKPGHLLRITDASIAQGSSLSQRRYWDYDCVVDDGMSYEDAVIGAREHLTRAVEIRLRADVPIAFCMSGGVDSNSLISIAKRVFDYDVHGFTIVNSDARYEEQDIIEQSVAELGIKHTNIPIDSGSFLSRMRELVEYHDAPVYTITYYAHWLLMRSVAEYGYRISVSGTAADELFSGYFDHQLFYLAEIHSDQKLFARSVKGWEENVKPIVRNPFLQDPYRFVHDPAARQHMFLNNDEFASWLHEPWSEEFAEVGYVDKILRNRMLNELFHEATPVILHEDDLNAMFYSIENRSPFLDRGLFEFCNSIPTRHLVREGYAKVVLRDAMRGIVPNCVLDNPRKVGFNAPIFSFLDAKDRQVREALLDDSPIFELIDRSKIEQVLGQESLPNSASKFLFYFISAKLFLESFSGGGSSMTDRAACLATAERGVV